MNEKKLTIRDIAAACGTSTATVSYILNDRRDQRISDETRSRVLHYVHLMGYRSSAVARALATGGEAGETRVIGLYAAPCGDRDTLCRRAAFARALADALEREGYLLALLGEGCLVRTARVDAILALDPTQSAFDRLGESSFFPLLCVDGVVESRWLFYQLNHDYAALANRLREKHGAAALVLPPFANDALNARIEAYFDAVHFYRGDDGAAARFLAALPRGSGNVLGGELCAHLRAAASVPLHELKLPQHAGAAAKLTLAVIRGSAGEEHDVLVSGAV